VKTITILWKRNKNKLKITIFIRLSVCKKQQVNPKPQKIIEKRFVLYCHFNLGRCILIIKPENSPWANFKFDSKRFVIPRDMKFDKINLFSKSILKTIVFDSETHLWIRFMSPLEIWVVPLIDRLLSLFLSLPLLLSLSLSLSLSYLPLPHVNAFLSLQTRLISALVC
jgi:hypothetical protein